MCCAVDVALHEPFSPVSLNTRLFVESDPSVRGQHVLTRQPSKRRAQALALRTRTATRTTSHSLRYAALCTHWLVHQNIRLHSTQSHTSDTHTHRRHTPELGLTLLAGLNCFVVFLGLLFWGLSWQATGRVYKPPPASGDHWEHTVETSPPDTPAKHPAGILNPLRVSKSLCDSLGMQRQLNLPRLRLLQWIWRKSDVFKSYQGTLKEVSVILKMLEEVSSVLRKDRDFI